MKKFAKIYQGQSEAELRKELGDINLQIAKLSVTRRVAPPKNSNEISTLRKKRAIVQTMLRKNQLGNSEISS